MKILHIDETFHPSFGYQSVPLSKYQSLEGNDVYIIAPDKDHIYPVYKQFGEYGENLTEEDNIFSKNTGVIIKRIDAHGYIFNRLVYKKKHLYAAINEINPDVIMVHCLETLTSMRVMIKFRKKYPLVFDSHMLAMATTSKFSKIFDLFFRQIFTKIIVREKYKVIRTQDDNYLQEHLGVPLEQSPFISFGTDTLLFSPSLEEKSIFLKENKLPLDSFIVLSTGKMSESKGGMILANAVKNKFNDRNVVIVIVANFDGVYERKVKEVFNSSLNTVLFYPVQKYVDLPKFYQIADVTIFPKQCSMSFYDAQSCGSPVISEKCKVNLDRNSHMNGVCYEGDYLDLRRCIEFFVNMKQEDYLKYRENSRSFIENGYSYFSIASRYTNELLAAMSLFKSKGNTSKK